MKTPISALLATVAGACMLTMNAAAAPVLSQSRPLDSSLSKIGKAIAYPVKKAAGNGSKVANHSGKAVAYPVRKSGENASKTAHKVTHP